MVSSSLSILSAQEQLPYCNELSYDLTQVSYIKFPNGATLADIAVYDLPELHTKKSVYQNTERIVNGFRHHESILLNRVNGVGNWKNGIRVTEFDNQSIKNYKLINGVRQLVQTNQLSSGESQFFKTQNSLFKVKGLLISKSYKNPRIIEGIFKTTPYIWKGYTVYEDRVNRMKLYKLNTGGVWHFITDRTFTTYTETTKYNKVNSWSYRTSIYNQPLESLLSGSSTGSSSGTNGSSTGGGVNEVYEEFVRIYTANTTGIKLLSFSSDITKDTLSNGLCVDRVFTEEFDNYSGCQQNLIEQRSLSENKRADINVFPNPFSGDIFTISLPPDLVGKNLKLDLYDALGKQIVSKTMERCEKEILFSGINLEGGIYFLRISGANYLHTKTINVIK